jgi:protein-L-isoaspartate(D-aspartate) O-methyltransferase
MNKQQLIKILRKDGFSNKTLNAFSKIKREDFIPKQYKDYAYENEPLPIGKGSTISQPYTIAFMLDLLELKDSLKVLEIGSGSGYVLALINEICKNCEVYGVEINKELVEKSKKVLKEHKNITVVGGDGSKGLKGKKFNRILISASSNKIPEHLFNQLEEKGIMVCPVKNSIFQIKKVKGRIRKKEFHGFVFVRLVED